MRFVCKTGIEKAWLVAAVGIFVMHRLLEGSSFGYYPSSPLRLWLELAMIVLSFPSGGLALFALHIAAVWCNDCRNLEFLFDWSTLLFAGYIQWFWLLPEFLRNRKLTLLNLERPPEIVSLNASPAVNESAVTAATFDATPAAAAVTPDDAKPRIFDAAPLPAFETAAFAPALAEFDEGGLTALDRVFQARVPPPAQASPSHVEAIFPRVS
ncbi:MAG TPA: hypothetical protein VK388_04285 [Pyrinomonadaceae bacterium]|nr:hypothetical protein [Pyrinomonadaceae bacterium]